MKRKSPAERRNTKDGHDLALTWKWPSYGKDRLTTRTRQKSFATIPVRVKNEDTGITDETELRLEVHRWGSGPEFLYEGVIGDINGDQFLSRDDFTSRVAAQEWAEGTLGKMCKAILRVLYKG